MRKRHFFKLYFPVFLAATALAATIAFMDIDHLAASAYIMVYAFLLVSFALSASIRIMMKIAHLPHADRLKRLKSFVLYFLLFALVNWLFPGGTGNVYELATPVGLAFGIAFFDLLFARKA